MLEADDDLGAKWNTHKTMEFFVHIENNQTISDIKKKEKKKKKYQERLDER